MVIQPTEKSWGSDYLRFGLALASDVQGDNAFNALVEYRSTWLNRLGGELQLEAQVGQNTTSLRQFYQPVTETGNGSSPSFYIGQQTRGVFEGDDKVADYLISAGRAASTSARRWERGARLRLGPVWSKVYARPDTGSPRPAVGAPNDGGAARGTCSSTRPTPPTSPHAGYGLHRHRLRRDDVVRVGAQYQRLEGLGARDEELGAAHVQLRRLGRHRASARTCPPTNPSRWAARCACPATDQPALGPEFAFGRAMYYNRILPLPDLLGSGVYVGGSAEVG